MTRLSSASNDAVLVYLKATEYYIGADGQQVSSSRWLGTGAGTLGLTGAVDIAMMESLAKGLGPQGQALRQNANETARIGYDFTFSSIKDFSVMFAAVDQVEKDKLLSTHDKSVEFAMDFLASQGQVRTGKAGRGKPHAVTGLVASAHTHYAARPTEDHIDYSDPQVHTHVLTYNCAQSAEDGKWRSLDTERQAKCVKAAGALYRAQHAWELKQQGFGIVKDRQLDADGRETGNVFFRIAGVSDDLTKAFSKRREAILTYQNEYGGTLEQATLATRKNKDEPTYAELTEIWGKSLEELRAERPGLVFNGLDDLKGRASELDTFTDHDMIERLHRTSSTFTYADVVERVALENVGRMDGPSILDEAQDFIRRNNLIKLERAGLRASNTMEEYTSPWMLAMEQRILARAEARVDDPSVRISEQKVEASIAKTEAKHGIKLSDEQRGAVLYQTCLTGGLCVVTGRAGAGKTTVSEPVVDAFRASGRNVIGVSTSWDAALKLEASAGIKSYSAAKLLHDLDQGKMKLTHKDVVIFDEAGMAGTEIIEKIQAYTDASKGKLIVQGDARQIPPVVAGNPFVALTKAIGATEIKTIMRQKNAADLSTAYMLYDEQERMGEKFMARLEERGQLSVHDNRKEAMGKLADDYTANPRKDSEKLVVVGTNSDVRALNDAIRASKKAKGMIGGEEVSFEAKAGGKWEKLTLAAGDRVRFSARDKVLGTVNGLYGVVEKIEPGRDEGSFRLSVRTESEVASQDNKRIVFDTADFKSLSLGYAGTVHKSQGQSIPDVYELANPTMADRNMQLVAFTRMKENYRLYGSSDDLADMGRRVSMERPKLNASDLLPAEKIGQVLGQAMLREQQLRKGKVIRK